MKHSTRTLITAGALALALVGCGGGGDDATARPGKQAVYDRIEAMTDCAELQSEFDTAMTNAERHDSGTAQRDAALSYAEAAEARMQDEGCH